MSESAVVDAPASTDLAERQTSLFADLEAAAHLPAGSVKLLGLNLTDPDMAYDDWEQLGRGLGALRRWSNWSFGDWYNFGEALYGQDAAQASEPTRVERMDLLRRVTGLAPATLANYASICARIALSRRRIELDFSVHEPVAALEPDEQDEWLQKAVDNTWGREELRQAIKEAKNPTDPDAHQEDDDDPLPEVPLSERIREAALLVCHQSQSTSDGSYLVPAEPMQQLLSAVGLE